MPFSDRSTESFLTNRFMFDLLPIQYHIFLNHSTSGALYDSIFTVIVVDCFYLFRKELEVCESNVRSGVISNSQNP